MSWELRLDFLGLTGLVPLDDGRWLVAFPDLKRGSDPKDKLPYHIDAHQALVAVASRHVHDDTSLPLRLKASSASAETNVYELSQHHVRWHGASDGGPDVQSDGDYDLSLVPAIGEIVPQARRFDGSLLANRYDEQIYPAKKLAATVLINRGNLGARGPITEDGGVSKYVFKTDYNADPVLGERRLADGFRVSVNVDDDTAALSFEDGDGTESVLVIQPNGKSTVTVHFHNEELEAVFGFPTDPVAPKLGDIDFAIFYRLSKGWSALEGQALPIPFRVSKGGGGKNKPCRNPQYDGVDYSP